MNQPPDSLASGRRIAGHAQLDPRIDPYQERQKPHEPAVCPGCGAVYHDGRWQWRRAPAKSTEHLCPACRRTNDHLPAGIVKLHGPFTEERIKQVVSLARHQEQAEKRDHPLNRIINIEQQDQALVITTTDIHLPRRLGKALKRTFRGELDMHFDEASYFVRVDWRPPD